MESAAFLSAGFAGVVLSIRLLQLVIARKVRVNSSLGSTNSAYSEANSSLGNHCIDLAFRHKARTPSPLSLCQNAKNSTSKTSNTRIFLNANDGDSMKDSNENNPVIARKSVEQTTHLSSLRGHSPKQSILQNQKSSDFADSSDFTQSNDFIDCHDSANAESRNDNYGAIPHKAQFYNDKSKTTAYKNTISYNDASPLSVIASETKQSIKNDDFIKNADSSRYRKYLHNIRHFIVAKSRPFSLQPFDILLMLVIVLWAYALYLSLKSGRADYCGSFDIMSGLSYLKATFKSVRGGFFTLFFIALALALCSARFRIIVLGGLMWIVVIIVFYTLTVSRCGATWYLMSGLFLSMLCALSVFVAIILRRFKALKSIVALVILATFLQPFEPYKERPRSSYEFFKSHSQSWIDLAINADKHNKKELTIYIPKDFPHYHWESWFFPAFSRTLKNYGLVRGEMEIEFKAME